MVVGKTCGAEAYHTRQLDHQSTPLPLLHVSCQQGLAFLLQKSGTDFKSGFGAAKRLNCIGSARTPQMHG